MELLQLKYFKTVAETGKISAAAESLFISSPALSTSVSRLEKELGMPLFDRTGNRIQLNRQGEIFLRYVNQIFSTIDCAKVELNQSMQNGQHVSIATTNSYVWTDLITIFSLEYPRFTLATTNLKASQLRSGEKLPQYTFLLTERRDLTAELACELDSIQLFEDQPVIMVHPSHPLASRTSVDIQELEQETLFFPTEDVTMYDRLVRLFQENGVILPSVNSFPYMIYRHMAEEGKGISFTTVHTSQLERAEVCYVPINNPRPWQMCLYWRKDRVLNKDETIFKNFVENFYKVPGKIH